MSTSHPNGAIQAQRTAQSGLSQLDAKLRLRPSSQGEDVLIAVDLSGSNVTDGDLNYLSELTSLESLKLMSCKKITSAGLVHLKPLVELKTLYLTVTEITDEGLVHLKDLEQLTELNLSSTKVTDEGVSHLTGLTNLVHLAFYETRITDAALEKLAGLTKLERLWLGRTNVTTDGIQQLARRLPRCRVDR